MGETVHCESFLSSMRDLSEDSNSCSWSMYQTGFSVRAVADSYLGYERDFLKQTMLEHEAVFKNQVYELHRLYTRQKSLMDEVMGKNFIECANQSEHTPELPGSSSQACNVSSKDKEVLEVRPVKVRRRMIDLELPADEYLDTDDDIDENASFRSWISSWENRSSSSVQKSLPLQTNPFLNFNTQARADLRNFNHLNNGSTGPVTHGSLKHQSLVSLQGLKKQKCYAELPWIKPKPPNENETSNVGFDLNASANQFMDGSDVNDCANNVSPPNGLRSVSCSDDASFRQAEMAVSHSRKVLGFPIPSSVCITDKLKEVNTLVKRNLDINLPCEAVVADKEESKKTDTYRHCIDLNLCASEDEDYGLCTNPRVETKVTSLIYLEALPTLESEEGEKSPEKREECEAGNSVDELFKAAAEAIVTISLSHHCCNTDEASSSSTDAAAKDPLSWFVNTIASCGSDSEKKIDACLETRDCKSFPEGCSSMEFDYFEATTLNLPQTKEEDYMPKPLVPEYLQFDAMAAYRPRRGQPRRGRPRRDFQTDVLPGLASLSKLEVTEDLQMFGGHMKATGYNSNSGVARTSSKRGRKRLVNNISRAPFCSSLTQPMNNNSVKMVGLEDKSFTGWGNTTRRPRRQRCPASTPPTVILT